MCQLLEPDKCPELAASSPDCLRLWVSRSRHLHLHNLLLAIEAYQRLSARDFRPACLGLPPCAITRRPYCRRGEWASSRLRII